MTRLGVVTGLPHEAECLKASSTTRWPRILCAGPGFVRASDAACRLIEEGCEALLSFGIAGGLDPVLATGAVVIANAVIGPNGERLPTDSLWRERLMAGLANVSGVHIAEIASGDEPVFTPSQKWTLRRRTGAAAVDMETWAIAFFAVEQRIPFLAIRTIADSWSQRIPRWIPATLGPDGRPRLAAVVAEILDHPSDLPALIRLARGAQVAFAALRRVAARAGPLFHFDAESLH